MASSVKEIADHALETFDKVRMVPMEEIDARRRISGREIAARQRQAGMTVATTMAGVERALLARLLNEIPDFLEAGSLSSLDAWPWDPHIRMPFEDSDIAPPLPVWVPRMKWGTSWNGPPDSALDRSAEHLRTAAAVMDRPAGVPAELPPTLPPDDYLVLAERIGLDSPELVQARLELFLWANDWPVYLYEKVWSYLEQLARREASRQRVERGREIYVEPFWSPLRAKDARPFMTRPGSWAGDTRPEAKPYERRVPAHALAKVEALEANFTTLAFFVSDYAAVEPDPFLMVLAGGKRYVVDVWDEPGW